MATGNLTVREACDLVRGARTGEDEKAKTKEGEGEHEEPLQATTEPPHTASHNDVIQEPWLPSPSPGAAASENNAHSPISATIAKVPQTRTLSHPKKPASDNTDPRKEGKPAFFDAMHAERNNAPQNTSKPHLVETPQPKHSRMALPMNRLASFSNWPKVKTRQLWLRLASFTRKQHLNI